MVRRILSLLTVFVFSFVLLFDNSFVNVRADDSQKNNVFVGATIKSNHSAASTSLVASYATDGDMSTRFSETNTATGNLVLTITLGKPCTLSGITLTERIGNYNRLDKTGLNIRVEYSLGAASYRTEGEYNLPHVTGSAGTKAITDIDFKGDVVADSVRLTVVDPHSAISSVATSEPNRKSQIEFFEIEGWGSPYEAGGNLMFYMNSPKARIGDIVQYIDESDISVTPQKIGSSVMLPVSFAARAFGAQLTLNDNTAHLTSENCSVSFLVNSKTCTVDDSTVTLTDAPVIIGNHMYVPVRDVCEAFGKGYLEDECGVVMAGDGISEISLADEADFEMLLANLRDIVYYDDIPTPEIVTEKLKLNNSGNAHPRLLIKREELSTLRNLVKTEEPYRSWMESILTLADSYLPKSYESLKIHYELEDGIRLLYVSRRAQEYITNLSFAYLMTEDEAYARKAIDIMLYLGGDEFPNWHPYHFLDVAEMAAGVALGYDWCYNAMTASERENIKNILTEYALKPVMEDYNEVRGRSRTWYWSSEASSAYPQNWISVCFGGTTLAALAIGDEDLGDFKEAGNVITEGMERMKDWLDRYMPDGVCVDGGLYWLLSMKYNALGINAMETALGTDFNLTDSPGFMRSFDWLIQLMGHDGVFNICGAPQGYENCADSPEFHWWSQKTGDGSYSDFRLTMSIGEWNCLPNFKDIIWYKKDIDQTKSAIRKDYINRNNMSFVTMKSGTEKLDTWVGMYSGTMNKSESDNDEEGSFAIDMLGTRWAVMLGTEGKVYSSSTAPRADYYRHRAEGENTLMINPDYGRFFDTGKRGKELKRIYNEASSLAVYDFSGMLESKGGQKWHRGVKLDRENQSVTVQDEFMSHSPSELYWFMHTDAQIEISADGKSAILSKDRRRIQVTLVSPDSDFEFEVMNAEPLPTSPNPEQSSNDGFKKLAIHADGICEADFAVEFVPLYSDGAHSQNHSFTPLDEWTLKTTSETDTSLKLTDIRINGKTISGFSPDKKVYSHPWVQGESTYPDITASSDNGNVTVTNPDGENTVSVITVTDRDNPDIKNEYFIEFYDYINSDNLFENQNVTVNVAAMNSSLPKSAITDGKKNTRYSTPTKPTQNVIVEISPKNGCWYLEGISIGEYFSAARSGRAGITAKVEYISPDGGEWQTAADGISLSSKNTQGYVNAIRKDFDKPVLARSVRISINDPQINTNPAQISFYEIEGYGKMYYPDESSYTLVKNVSFVTDGVVTDKITDEENFAVRAVYPEIASSLLAGCYDEHGNLICAGLSDSGGDIAMHNPERLKVNYVKIYLWKSAENVKPICKAFEMPLAY